MINFNGKCFNLLTSTVQWDNLLSERSCYIQVQGVSKVEVSHKALTNHWLHWHKPLVPVWIDINSILFQSWSYKEHCKSMPISVSDLCKGDLGGQGQTAVQIEVLSL